MISRHVQPVQTNSRSLCRCDLWGRCFNSTPRCHRVTWLPSSARLHSSLAQQTVWCRYRGQRAVMIKERWWSAAGTVTAGQSGVALVTHHISIVYVYRYISVRDSHTLLYTFTLSYVRSSRVYVTDRQSDMCIAAGVTGCIILVWITLPREERAPLCRHVRHTPTST